MVSSSSATTTNVWYCPHCHAKQLGPATNCWLCEKPLTGEPASAGVGMRNPPAEAGSPDVHPERFHFSLATMLLLMTLVSVCMGLIVALPGLGILACILMGPVFIRTFRVVRHREAQGKTVSPGQKVSLFAGSFAVASVIAIVACVCAFCTFCGVCASVIVLGSAGSGTGREALPFVLVTIPVALITFWLMIRLIKWNRRRFRQEIGEE